MVKRHIKSIFKIGLYIPDSLKQIKGRIVIRFWVNIDGRISDFEILSSLHPVLDSIALNEILSLRDLNPALKQGVPIKYYLEQPFNIKNIINF